MGNGSGTPYTNRVRQASGMVSVQATCSFEEAIVLMKDRAATEGQTLDEIASAVIDRLIRFGE